MSEYLGFRLCNLVIPGDPEELELKTPSGIWHLERESRYAEVKQAIEQGQIGETYCLMTNVVVGQSGRSAALDAVCDELVPICLAASYLTGASVAITRSLPHSECTFVEVGPHFPRPRAMQGIDAAVTTQQEFTERVEAFVRNHPSTGLAEKDRLLVHHWIDAVACWSMEDLCLSTATLLEIIAATANRTGTTAGQTLKSFNQRIQFAATRFALPALSADFRNMRNDLVHEGTLSIKSFPNKSNADCAKAVAEALHWIDQYIHAALGLGPLVNNRFPANTFRGLNAFSLD
jgi:hypothetical protein